MTHSRFLVFHLPGFVHAFVLCKCVFDRLTVVGCLDGIVFGVQVVPPNVKTVEILSEVVKMSRPKLVSLYMIHIWRLRHEGRSVGQRAGAKGARGGGCPGIHKVSCIAARWWLTAAPRYCGAVVPRHIIGVDGRPSWSHRRQPRLFTSKNLSRRKLIIFIAIVSRGMVRTQPISQSLTIIAST